MAARKPAKTVSPKRKSPATAKAAPKRSAAGSRSLALSVASPSLTVNDLQKSLAWYRDVVGFALEETWKDDAGKVMGVSLRAGNVSLMIGQDDWKKGRDRKKGEGFRLYCETKQDVDTLAKGIVARGGLLESGPQDQPWGTRDFTLSDPDGFKITITTPVKS